MPKPVEPKPLDVVVWSDDGGGRELGPDAAQLHPEGVAATVARFLGLHLPTAQVSIAGLHQPEDGLPESLLDRADVLVWWGHEAHERVADFTVARVQARIRQGLGLVALHSAHHSKVFRALMGTSCDLVWRDGGEDRELIWTVDPRHPIAAGVPHPIEVGEHEMYGEPFRIRAPDAIVFISSFSGGEVFRSGCCFNHGAGRIFYFGPGHETYPVYNNPHIQRVITNAVGWAARSR